MLNNLKSYIYIIRYFFFNKNLFKKKKIEKYNFIRG